jgi:protein-L-isoaspartate(D-aspartate) O-methyltransferase
MKNFQTLRTKMVDGQLRTNDVTNHHILRVFLETPKDYFVPVSEQELAYSDDHVELRAGTSERKARYLVSSMLLAKMIQALDLQPHDIVLDIGCGMGYSTAIMARLASSIIGLEEDEVLAQKATDALQMANIPNAVVVEGPLQDGLPKEGPFDAILIAGHVDTIPQTLFEQLNDRGRMITVTGGQGLSAMATLYVKNGQTLSHHRLFNAAVPSLQAFEKKKEFVF